MYYVCADTKYVQWIYFSGENLKFLGLARKGFSCIISHFHFRIISQLHSQAMFGNEIIASCGFVPRQTHGRVKVIVMALLNVLSTFSVLIQCYQSQTAAVSGSTLHQLSHLPIRHWKGYGAHSFWKVSWHNVLTTLTMSGRLENLSTQVISFFSHSNCLIVLFSITFEFLWYSTKISADDARNKCSEE